MLFSIFIIDGRSCYVDAEDIKIFCAYNKWHIRRTKNSPLEYLVAYRKSRPIFFHRIVLDPKPDEVTDHINGNGLDNRRCNLRKCTHAQNMRNRKVHTNNKCGFKGVYKVKNRNLWRAEIRFQRERIKLGYFKTAVLASVAYDNAALKYHGEFARTNH